MIINGNGSFLNVEAGGKDMTLGNRIKLENFTVLSDAGKDSADVQLRWNNWQDFAIQRQCQRPGKSFEKAGNYSPHIEIDLLPASIVTNDTVLGYSTGKYKY